MLISSGLKIVYNRSPIKLMNMKIVLSIN
jgi:hypothetical protein